MSKINLLVGRRLERETDAHVIACNDYLRLGPGRTLAKLGKAYFELPTSPTKSVDTLKYWSKKYRWVVRAQMYDGRQEARRQQSYDAELTSGLALSSGRVAELKKMAELLLDELYEVDENGRHSNLWVTEEKMLSGGAWGKKTTVRRFNEKLVRQLRGIFDDLAQETGARVRQVDVSWRQMLPPGVDLALAEQIFAADVTQMVKALEEGDKTAVLEGEWTEPPRVPNEPTRDEIGRFVADEQNG